MAWQTWLAFVAASAVLGLIPGPAVVSIVGYVLGAGRRVALASVAGVALGNLIAISLSLAGVGALLAASALLFGVVKWAGVVYLVGLGVLTVARSGSSDAALARSAPITPRAAFLSNVLLGATNPKTIIFFIAFVPQFIHADAAYGPQAVLLVVTFSAVLAVTDLFYVGVASRAAHWLRRPGAALWSRRAGGGALIAAGLATAAVRN